MKDLPKAEESWNKAVTINPRYFQMYANLMMICQAKKDDDCMFGYLRTALKNGMTLQELQSKGIVVSDQLLARARQ